MTEPTASAEQSPRSDLRLVPIAAAGWAGSWLGTAGRPLMIMIGGALLVVVVLTATLRRSWLLAATALMLAGALGLGWLQAFALTGSAVGRLAGSGAIARIHLVTKADPMIRPPEGVRGEYLTVRAVLTQGDGRGLQWRERTPILLTASGDAVPGWRGMIAGSSMVATVKLQTPQPGSDFAAVARAVGPPREVKQPGPVGLFVERVRSGLRQAVARGSPEQRALVPSLVLGDTAGITDDIKADFLTTGLTHLTAVSGANLAILIAFLMVLARWGGVRGWWLRVVGLAAVVVFVLLCRTEPSVLRAAAMGLVALAALGMSGRAAGLRSLSVATIVLIMVDPWLGRSLGFALSVLATGGIVWWARRWVQAMQRWLPVIFAEAVAVPLAAHLATLPVAAAISGQVSMVGILTNAIAGPFVGPATVLGFAAAGLSLMSGMIAGWVGLVACWAAQPILWTAHFGSALPGASWSWPSSAVALLVLGAGCLAVALVMPWVLRSRWLALGVAVFMVVAVVRAPVQPGWPPKDWLLVACDVGQGDGLAVRVGDRQAIVIDTGPDPAPIRRCLDQLGIRRVPLLILSHYHADHVGGLEGVLAGRRVERVWTSPYPSPPQEAAGVADVAGELGIPSTVPEVGVRATVGAATVAVLGPSDRAPTPTLAADGESSTENDLCLVVKITIGGVRLLLTGDVEPAEQERVLASGVDLGADVLKVPHHGSSRQDAGFVAATGARVAIASAGVDNDYGHPAPRTMQLLRGDGMTALCTCQRGSIAVAAAKAGGGDLVVITQRTP
ncbi:ComEC/Rec2 family competence protein [Microlunatus soli]|uniref:Competence protein ComEC n=1 Tax=Microlunatus soli TaxID=630515 RepID=A0A1H1YL94_9ACTN|nr:ComEC/Rec2 family competence protein [Microlunatus soli]SDT22039.1 competence protein ComEC [Microlunatus soli]